MMNERVLIISCNCLSETNSNGKTILDLLKVYGLNNLYQFYTYDEIPKLSEGNYYRITDFDVLRFRLYKTRKCGNIIKADLHANSVAKGLPTKCHFENAKRLLRDIIWYNNNWYDFGLTEWIDQITPTFIFFVGINNPYLYKLCISIKKKYNIPVMIYMTDDYLSKRLQFSPSFWIRNLTLNYWFRKLCEMKRVKLFTVNEVMQDYYRSKYNCESAILTHYINSPFVGYKYNSKSKRVVYIGNLLHNRWKSLLRFADILHENCPEFLIDVYPGNSINERIKRQLLKKKNIRIGRYLNQKEVVVELRRADFLLHLESFDYNDICLARYSFSTKLTEYAASCTPIIAFCPKSVASYIILKNHKLAICIDNTEQSIIKNVYNQAFLDSIVHNAYYYFQDLEKKFDMKNLINNELRNLRLQ